MTKASKAISCDSCAKWTHVRCCAISIAEYDECVIRGGEINFTCDRCSWASLPFNDGGIDVQPDAAGAGAAPALPSQVSVNVSSGLIPNILTSKGLHLLHANVRSLFPKIPEVQHLLGRTKASIFAVTETWLDRTVGDGEIHVPGFSVVRQDRNRQGGGVALYIKNDITFNPRPDLAVDGLEATWIELLFPRSKGILVCSCYRPPTDHHFLSKLEQCLARVDPGTELYILGDINIDFTQQSNSLCKSYLDLLNLEGLSQIITEPTRLTPTTATTLDHIIVNVSHKNLVKECGVVDIGFSDHLVTYCSRGLKNISCVSNVKRIRSFRNYTALRLKEALMNINWSSVLLSTNVDYCLAEFTRLFDSAVDLVAPFHDVRVKGKSNPWMNSTILAGIKLRDSLLSRFKKDRSNSTLYSDFCRVRNRVQRDIKMAKQSFFVSKVNQNRGNSGKLWGHLKSLGYKSGSNSSSITLEENGITHSLPFDVASCFNRFYSTVASNLVSALPSPLGLFNTSSYAFRMFYRRFSGSSNSFVLSPVSRGFVLKQLRSLNPHKAIGIDGISPKLLRDGAEALVEPVTHLINMSILTETVPKSFKQAKVVPLFKKGSRLDPGNYRPVSILNILSKVLERAVHKQLSEYFERRGVLFDNQSGFRSNYSTDTCMINLTDYIKKEVAKGNLVGMVLIDLQKAFDTVDHEILLSKLSSVGISSVSWFRSYLFNRSQCVEVNGSRSDFLEITCGVPQGSILGPLLFLLYINDMHISVKCGLSLYADDSALFYAHKDPTHISCHLSEQLSSCRRWLIDNKLSLHVGKTESIIFGSNKRLKRVDGFEVTCERTVVKKVANVRYLGIQLDGCLDGRLHAESVITKCAGRLSFLYRNSHLLDSYTRKILCSSLIQPQLDYCCSFWYGGLTKKLKDRLNVLQRKMIRFSCCFDARHHVDSKDLLRLSWLSIPDRVKYFRLCHVFKIKMGTAPRYLTDDFVQLTSSHTHRTRGSTSNHYSYARCAGSDTSFSFLAIRDWNALPPSVTMAQSFPIFKSRLKSFLFASY